MKKTKSMKTIKAMKTTKNTSRLHLGHTDFDHATGTIDYRFTNDYMFRAILQNNQRVLKALICALLHLRPEDVKSITITNPIELGKTLDNKDFILDIAVLLNNNTFINLEMQVQPQLNWTERSLSYLCRSFDQLHKGDYYGMTGPAIHIGFLDFTPFTDCPEFYATYKLLNVKNGNLYSDKFILSVIDLTQIHLATTEDRDYQIDYWAKLFSAGTWEELRMIAKKDKYLHEASETLYTLNADETIRQQCQARDDYYRLQNTINRKMDELTAENEKLVSENDKLASEKDKLVSENDKLASEKDKLVSENDVLKKLLEQNGITYP